MLPAVECTGATTRRARSMLGAPPGDRLPALLAQRSSPSINGYAVAGKQFPSRVVERAYGLVAGDRSGCVVAFSLGLALVAGGIDS